MSNKIELQKEYCSTKIVPLFIPLDGMCYKCNRNIFNGSKGYTEEQAKAMHITGCPYCYVSFCE